MLYIFDSVLICSILFFITTYKIDHSKRKPDDGSCKLRHQEWLELYIRFQVTFGLLFRSDAAFISQYFVSIVVSTEAMMSMGSTNDSLKRFIKRIGFQEGLDDDTDSEDDTVEDAQSSHESVNVTPSLYALCAPSLLAALQVPIISWADEASDKLVLVLRKCAELSTTAVQSALNEFVRVLSSITDTRHAEHYLIQRYLTMLCRKKHTKMLAELTDVLLSHIQTVPVAAAPTTAVLQFLLLMLSDNPQEASELIQRQVLDLHSRTFGILSSDKQDNEAGSDTYSTVLDLQYILKLLETNYIKTNHCNTTAEHPIDGQMDIYAALRGQLSAFAHQYSALLPLMSCAIRNAAMCTALSVNARYAEIFLLFSNIWREYYHSYCVLLHTCLV